MPTAKKTTEIVIPAPNRKLLTVTINGTAPLIYHAWDEKAIQMILDKQMKKAAKPREAKNPEEDYKRTYYYDSEKNIAYPARNIKQAIVGSARFLNGVQMTILRGAIFVKGDAEGMIPVKYKSERMRRDMVTVGMGSADIRFRGELTGWSMGLTIEYDADLLSPEQVLNLLQRAGFSQGLGEWRPEKNGDFGTFEIQQN